MSDKPKPTTPNGESNGSKPEKPLSRVPRDVPPPPKPDPRIIPPAIKGQYPRRRKEAPISKG